MFTTVMGEIGIEEVVDNAMGSVFIEAHALKILICSSAFYWQYFACDHLYPIIDRKLPKIPRQVCNLAQNVHSRLRINSA